MSFNYTPRYTKMKTATNIYIFNLALADALVLATLPFQGMDVLLGFWPFGLTLCKMVVAIDYYNMFTSIFTLTVMSVNRYIAVCHPVRSLAVRTPESAKLVNVAVWVLASAIGIPVMLMGQVEAESNGSHHQALSVSFIQLHLSTKHSVTVFIRLILLLELYLVFFSNFINCLNLKFEAFCELYICLYFVHIFQVKRISCMRIYKYKLYNILSLIISLDKFRVLNGSRL